MAIIEVNFISKCLMRVVTFNAIIPVDKFEPAGGKRGAEATEDALPFARHFRSIIRTG